MTDSLHESLEKISKSATALAQTDDVELAERFARIAEFAIPPSNNMGGTPPPPPQFFSHDEKNHHSIVQKTSIDWFGFTTTKHVEGVVLGLQILWPEMVVSTSKAGMKGYPEARALFVGEVQFGMVGFGAKHGRNNIALTGVACKTITTNEQFETLRGLMDVLEARLTRVDLCFDFYKGEVTFDYAMRAYVAGEFKAKNAPKNPPKRVIETTGPDGENLGRTLYIGPREAEKFGRIYEKGLEVFAKLPEEYREACTERELQVRAAAGDKAPNTVADDWLRLEVEFKRVEKDRPIPLEIILERDLFFAGAYPFFAWALDMGDGKGRSRLKSDAQMNHDRLIMAHRQAYGNHVHTLRKIGFTDKEILDLLDTGRHNQRLLKTGLVAVEQQAIRQHRFEGDDSDIPF